MSIWCGALKGSRAPLGHTCVHSSPSHTTHAAMSGLIAGVRAAAPYAGASAKMALAGHASMH